MSDGDTYLSPAHGWTCFHCGETFMSPTSAREHFGPHPGEEPGCVMRLGAEQKSLLRRLRSAEAELARYRAEDSDKDRAMGAMRGDHARALICEEEKGYEKGLRDGRAELERVLNTPIVDDWLQGVRVEAVHQVARWSADQDAGKSPADWFWLVGYLAGKALFAAIAGDVDKARHHTISTGAAMFNWWRHISGDVTAMRPGIQPPKE